MTINTNNAIAIYQALQNQNKIESLQNTQAPLQQTKKDDKALKEQTDNFEAIILQLMLKDTLKNDNPLYPKQPGSDIYHSMYLENLAENLSGSFGYSELLYNYLKNF